MMVGGVIPSLPCGTGWVPIYGGVIDYSVIGMCGLLKSGVYRIFRVEAWRV